MRWSAEIEDYAAKNRVPIIGPAVARLLTLLVQVSGAKRIFEMGSAIGYSTIWLARAAGPEGRGVLHRRRSGKSAARSRLFPACRRSQAHPRPDWRRART